MNFSIDSFLSNTQKQDALRLIQECKNVDGFEPLFFLDNNYNFDDQMPCFFTCYYNDKLIGFLSIFATDNTSCEIYAFVCPKFRKQRIATQLFRNAHDILDSYDIEDIYIPVTPSNNICPSILTSHNFSLSYSEYILHRNNPSGEHFIVRDDLSVELEKSIYSLTYNNKNIGQCCIDINDSTVFLYDIQILSEYRGLKFGSYLFEYSLHDLYINGYKKVFLQVNSENTVAYNMYLRHGFSIYSQVDYWLF